MLNELVDTSVGAAQPNITSSPNHIVPDPQEEPLEQLHEGSRKRRRIANGNEPAIMINDVPRDESSLTMGGVNLQPRQPLSSGDVEEYEMQWQVVDSPTYDFH